MEFRKNDLINETLDKNFETWSHTLDTADFVPKKYLNRINKIIFNNLQRKLREAEVYYLLYLQEQGYKLGLFQRFRIWLSGLRPLYKTEEEVKNLQSEIEHLQFELEELRTKKKRKKQEIKKNMDDSPL